MRPSWRWTGTLWLVGLSGAGKTTLALATRDALVARGHPAPMLLDGDVLRRGLCADLGFSLGDRAEQLRRTREVAKLFNLHGVPVIAALISPLEADRALTRQRLQDTGFLEIYVRCPLEICEARDPKGLYHQARRGLVPEFTGISSPFEEPKRADLVLPTHELSVEACVEQLLDALDSHV